ncbi:metastasis-associated protein MTA3-like isoform X1 [Octopus vulgaris]|uniref:Metastasis-associated protein MTA3-like isoform X1 n=1 Tax=Octopus vulgaris TaxID=6645 RepID=A0AA36F2I8_OCTVU|nr:metastasis-associated protein MTA3-like isoform X1 [Octopus vulgaris]
MAANMYRVGDYVYFETSSTTPYQIRRIEELNKTPNGNVEAKVMCFYRRRDISSSLILLADKHQKFPFSETSEDSGHEPLAVPPLTTAAAAAGPFPSLEEDSEEINDDITEKQRHQLKHRELFLSRQVETLPATHIRGKCVVTLLNETESLLSYLNKEDTFFYSLVYDPQQKTLLADKGEIRVGSKYQAEITPLLKEGEKDGRSLDELEQLIWLPGPDNTLTPKEIDQFLILARSVGTFARALDCTSTVRQPSLHMSAAAASRDVTLFHAMDTLHRSGYDIAKAVTSLVPQGGPVLCRDEMEEWSASEANLFEEALDKYGKDFNDIRQDFLPWKSLKSIIEYYYMWKTTDRYVQQKRIKAAEAESKLKQVYIPNYNKPNPAAISGKVNGVDGQVSGRACESCYAANSSQWYSWGPAHMQCRLCSSCWIYWKKYGGLKMPTRLDHRIEKSEADRIDPMRERLAHLNAMRMHRCTIAGCGKEFKLKPHLARHLATAHGLAIRAGSPRPMMKTRAAFCLITTPLTRISRRLCKDILRPRHAARCPFVPINIAAIKQESAGLPIFQDGSQGHLIDALTASTEKRTDNNGQLRLTEGGSNRLSMNIKAKTPATLESIVSRLGIDIKMEKPSMFCRPEGDQRKQPQRLSFPPVSSPMTRLPEPKMEPIVPRVSTSQPSIMKKRGYEQSNGLDARISHKPQQYERPKQNLWNKAYENAHDQLD